jgi:molybdate transport system substrate-binding protein
MAALLGSCGAPQPSAEITIAAAANLTDVFGEIGRAFQARTGIRVILSFGSTVQLAQQIENGAPFDLFAAADTQHVDSLVSSGKLSAGSRAVYALGQLALWFPSGEQAGVRDIKGLADPRIRYIAIAQPDLAPYGEAAVEALKDAHLWGAVMQKLVYANNINQTRQLAISGNADAAFTAYSLVLRDQGTVIRIDPHLYRPIEQAMGIVAASPHLEAAKRFRAFLLGPEGRAILSKNGYLLPRGESGAR